MQRKNSNAKVGFTIMELLVVTAILSLLAAISSPIISRAKESAKISSSIGRLKQMNLAVRLYLDSDDSTERLSHSYFIATRLGLGEDYFISPCGRKRKDNGTLYIDSYWYNAVPYTAASYFSKYGDNAIQFADADCNAEGVWDSRIALKRVLAITDGGQLINRMKAGNPSRIEWWMSLTEPLN
jgi:prepilin-type N-terminal cleavage/methylation domain-containing protein